ncbi:MAG: tetratricopeptide repeat protein [Planctomycetota bacterium]|nr:tetratricopeptide repeat protein [Planctomycetota bacterium]
MRGNLRDKLALALLAAALTGLAGCGMQQNAFSRSAALEPKAASPEWYGGSAVAGAKAMAAYDAAVAMVDAGQYAKAEPAFAQLVGQFRQARDADRTSKSWFWMAYCLEKQGQGEAACGEYQRLLAEYPASQAAKVAQSRLERMRMAPAPPALPRGE